MLVAGGTLNYTENDPATMLAPSLTVSDVDNGETGATVAVTSNFRSGEDVLSYTAPGGNPVTGSYDAGTGVLTLSGGATPAQYQAALRAVSYRNSSDAPDTSLRVATFTLNGAAGVSGSALRSIQVTPVPDPPTIVTTAAARSYTENDGPVAVDAGVNAGDPDGTLTSARVSIPAGYAAGQDTLAFTPIAGNPITASWNAATGQLDLTGSATPAQYQAALRNVTFENSSESPDESDRTVVFTVSDGTFSRSASRLVQVSSVPDAPSIDVSAGSLDYTEDDPATAIDAAATLTDADSGIIGLQVSITNRHPGQDELGYTAPAGNPATAQIDPDTGVLTITGATTPAEWQAALRAVTYRNSSQNPSEDDREIVFTVDGGGGLTDAATRTVTVTRTADAPTLTTTATALTYTENDSATAVDPGVDADDPDGVLNGATVTITGGYEPTEDTLALPAIAGNPVTATWDAVTGTLTLTGSTDPADYRAALRNVTYENNSQDPSTAARTVTFAVSDGTRSADSTRSVQVVAVNDDPVVQTSPDSVAIDEGGAPTVVDPGIGVVDAEGAIATASVTVEDGYEEGRDVLAFARSPATRSPPSGTPSPASSR